MTSSLGVEKQVAMESSRYAHDMPIPNPRRGPKSRGGCLRCKAKRLKCDETKPSCCQCERRRVQCPGYRVQSFVWSTKHEKSLPPPAASLPLPSRSPPRDGENSTGCSEENDTVLAKENSSSVQEELEARATTSPSSQPSPTITNSRRESGTFTDSLSAIRQQLHRSTVPEFLLHLPTMLVDYYFNYVCQIFSSFDGTLNPFRSTVGKLWDGSAPIYYAIQSMAAAYLANHFPRMLPVGVQMQRETYRCLYQVQNGREKFENLDKTLLTVLLVGQTTAWHNPKDLGLMHLKTAKRLNKRRLEQQTGQIGTRARRQNEFFEQCILYWDMLAGFVDDDIDEFGLGELEIASPTSPVSEATTSNEEEEKVFPHPWTGVAPKVQRLFAQVGRLIRTYRKSAAANATPLDFLSLDFAYGMHFSQDSSAMTDAVSRAQSLEEELLSFEPPSASSLIDSGDENTPVQQYIYLAEAYRCAALLAIYRVFPSVLFKRVPIITDNTFPPSSSTSNTSQQTFVSLPIPTSQSPDDFIVSLAIHTISLLEKLPPTSGTRCLQPIVIITAGSELRFVSASMSDPLAPFAPAQSSSVFSSITNREVDIASARQFVVTRLQEFQLSLPAKPILKALQLIQETWARADLGQEVFWMDVMEEMGWESIFG